LKRHEDVDLPFGTFRVVERGQRPHRRWRFGQPQSVFQQRYRVAFLPRERDTSGES
jgi:nucleoid DNA-binding protein